MNASYTSRILTVILCSLLTITGGRAAFAGDDSKNAGEHLAAVDKVGDSTGGETPKPSQEASSPTREKEPEVPKAISHLIIIVDATRSMHHACGDYKRLGIAQWVVSDLLDVAPDRIPTAVLVLQGAVSEKRSLAPLIPSHRSDLRRTMVTLAPQGMGELKECFERTQAVLAPHVNARPLVVMVTDGDDCHPGEAHGAAAQLAKQFTQGMVFALIGVGCQDATARQLESLAQAGGGSYTRVDHQRDVQQALSKVCKDCAIAAAARIDEREAARDRAIEKLLAESAALQGLIKSQHKEIDAAQQALQSFVNDKVISAINTSTDTMTGLRDDLKREAGEHDKREGGLSAQLKEGNTSIGVLQQKIDALRKSTEPIIAFYDRVQKLLPDTAGGVVAWIVGLLGITSAGAVGGGSVVRRGIIALLRQLLDAAEGNLKDTVGQLEKKVQGGVDKANEVGQKIDAVPDVVRQRVAAEVSPTVQGLTAGIDAVRAEVTHSAARALDKIDALHAATIERVNSSERQLAGAIDSVHVDVKQSIPAIRQQATEAVLVPLTGRLAEIEAAIQSGDRDVQLHLERKSNDALVAASAHAERLAELFRSGVGEIRRDVSQNVTTGLGAIETKIEHSTETLSNRFDSLEQDVHEKIGCSERQLRSHVDVTHVDVKRMFSEVTLQLTETVKTNVGAIQASLDGKIQAVHSHVSEKAGEVKTAMSACSAQAVDASRAHFDQLQKGLAESRQLVESKVTQGFDGLEGQLRAAQKELSEEARDAAGKAAELIAKVAQGTSDVARKCDTAQKSIGNVKTGVTALKRELRTLGDELPSRTALAVVDVRGEAGPPSSPPAKEAA